MIENLTLTPEDYSLETLRIIHALKEASSCEDVYHALWHVPTYNLEIMRDMIESILITRGQV